MVGWDWIALGALLVSAVNLLEIKKLRKDMDQLKQKGQG